MLAVHTGSQWKAFQSRVMKWSMFTVITDFHVDSLIAISIWVNAKIVHGTFTDESSLSVENVADLVQREVCFDIPHKSIKCPKFRQKQDYHKWKREMYLYLESQLNKENFRSSYIVRPTTLPSEFSNIWHELEFVVVNDGLTVTSKHDSMLVYSIMHASITCEVAKTYIKNDNKKKCERFGWVSLKSLYEGKDNKEIVIWEILAKIAKQNYSGNGQGNAHNITSRSFMYYKDLADLKKFFSDADKLRHHRGIINLCLTILTNGMVMLTWQCEDTMKKVWR